MKFGAPIDAPARWMTVHDHGDRLSVSAPDARGLQIGDRNSQTNVHLDASLLPPPQRITSDGPVHNLPPASGVFVGRDLTRLAMLLSDSGSGVAGRAAIHGLGGVGKTELALQYALSYSSRYRLVWWVTADTAENVDLGLAALTGRLHPVATLADAQAWAVGWLQSHTDWLLVLDNVEAVEDVTGLLGQVTGRGHVLVTTRRDLGQAWWVRLRLAPLPLGPLQRAAGVELLMRLTGSQDMAAADRLAADLGDLPLALEQAGGYISQHHGLAFDDYRERLATQFARMANAFGPVATAQRTVASVWQVTMRAVRASSEPAHRVMQVLAWLAPEALPQAVLLPVIDDPVDLDDVLALLSSYNMIVRSDGSVGMHRLVQAVIRVDATTDQLDAAVRLLDASLPGDPVADVANWPRWNELLPHIDAVLARLPAGHTDTTALDVGERAATYRLHQGHIAKAVAAFEQILADRQRVLGENHPDTLTTRGNLADAYHDAGRIDEAIAVLQQLLTDQQRLVGDDDPNTLSTRGNLAVCHHAAGRVDQAVAAFEELLTDRRRVLGEYHPDTLTTRNNLADAYLDGGRTDEAVSALEQLLTDQRRVHGDNHPHTLVARNNLASSMRIAGRLDEAITAFEQLLTDQRRVLGDDHPHTLTTRNNLASSNRVAGRLDEAITAFEQLLTDQRRVLGDDHPDTLHTRGNLGVAFRAAGRVDEAVVMFEQLLADHQRVLGDDHPDTLNTRGNLAGARFALGRVDEAVAEFERLLVDSERVLGNEHPRTAAIRHRIETARGLPGGQHGRS
ncbi:FxSxx-COOH system tetratricopeptide repeat protein [Dactylosporangium maewongense]|uniref:FxSxx-COOH system tetratricopeptide repeat protein n=1 Tax=Dactylosporangium maewongense TaxID=634393 RepID=A0ABN2BQ28_9ACTN